MFPSICGICHQKSQVSQIICEACRSFLPWAEDRCFRCGKKNESNNNPHEMIVNPSLGCQTCALHPPSFDRLCTLFNYDSPISELILGLKFKKKLSEGALLGKLLSENILKWYQRYALPEALIPVPLHPIRLRERGYNQSLEILKPCQKLLTQYQIPILHNICKRIRHTTPQAELKAEKRNRNLHQSFYLMAPLKFKHVAILDDVVTTGSTVNALSKVLKKAGVEIVDFLRDY